MCACAGVRETLRPLFLAGLGTGADGGLGAGYGGSLALPLWLKCAPHTPTLHAVALYSNFFFFFKYISGKAVFSPVSCQAWFFFFNTCILHQAVKPPRGVTHSSGSSKPGVCREHSDRDNRARALQAARKRPPQPGPVGVAPFGLVPQFMKC